MEEVVQTDFKGLYENILRLKPAECHVLNKGKAIAINYTGKAILIGDNPDFHTDTELARKFYDIIPLIKSYDTSFLAVPNFIYSIWVPLPLNEINRAKHVSFCPSKLNSVKIIPPPPINWNHFAIKISYKSSLKLNVKGIVDCWISDVDKFSTWNERIVISDVEYFSECILLKLSSKQDVVYCLIDLYLQLRFIKQPVDVEIY